MSLSRRTQRNDAAELMVMRFLNGESGEREAEDKTCCCLTYSSRPFPRPSLGPEATACIIRTRVHEHPSSLCSVAGEREAQRYPTLMTRQVRQASRAEREHQVRRPSREPLPVRMAMPLRRAES